ncbi:TadE/TadG family type IV pilus assembly protein [Phreatobacter sp. HK31-P]
MTLFPRIKTLSLYSNTLCAITRSFNRCDRGVVAMIFAFCTIPLAGFAGMAVDYAQASKVKAKLDSAADAAVLVGVKVSSTMPTAVVARLAAEASFKANTGSMPRVEMKSLAIEVKDTGLTRRGSMTYEAAVPTSLLAVVGISEIRVSGRSEASSNTPAYIDFHIMLDNTPSMGLGATQADIDKMVANTRDKCAFACHDLSDGNNYYKLAKKLGVTLRIDVLRQATQQLMDTAQSTMKVQNQFRAGIYTYGTSCTQTTFTTIAPLTTNLASARSAANAIDLMTIPYQGYNNDQCTDNTNTLAALSLAIPTPGDGSNPSVPQKVLLLVSDGVTDAYYPATCTRPTTNGRCQEPINPDICTAIKARGVRIAVLYTTYLRLPTNAWYMKWIEPFQPTIGTRMQACASPGLYFEVSPTQGIMQAMDALFQKAVATARITS